MPKISQALNSHSLHPGALPRCRHPAGRPGHRPGPAEVAHRHQGRWPLRGAVLEISGTKKTWEPWVLMGRSSPFYGLNLGE